MKKALSLGLLCIFSFALLYSHEADDLNEAPKTWFQWVATFHLVFLHFPIALINMLVVSEILEAWTKKEIFAYSSSFLIITAAIFAVPTAILGWMFSFSSPYTGIMETLITYHMWFGISTAILSVILAFYRGFVGQSKLYYWLLALLFLIVNTAGFLGADLTFGLYHLYPPIN